MANHRRRAGGRYAVTDGSRNYSETIPSSAHAAHGYQRVDDLRQALLPRTATGKARRDGVVGQRCACRSQYFGYRFDLRGQRGRPRAALAGFGGNRNFFTGVDLKLLSRPRFRLAGYRNLELGPQPADQAALFFGGALGVERHKPFEQRVVERALAVFARRRRAARAGRSVTVHHFQQRREIAPAIGVEHGAVEFVVQRLEHCDQPVLVDHYLFRVERFAGFQLFEHVVHTGQREVGVLRLLALAVRVELFGEIANAGLLFSRSDGKTK